MIWQYLHFRVLVISAISDKPITLWHKGKSLFSFFRTKWWDVASSNSSNQALAAFFKMLSFQSIPSSEARSTVAVTSQIYLLHTKPQPNQNSAVPPFWVVFNQCRKIKSAVNVKQKSEPDCYQRYNASVICKSNCKRESLFPFFLL